jgi:hypothetical protein
MGFDGLRFCVIRLFLVFGVGVIVEFIVFSEDGDYLGTFLLLFQLMDLLNDDVFMDLNLVGFDRFLMSWRFRRNYCLLYMVI